MQILWDVHVLTQIKVITCNNIFCVQYVSFEAQKMDHYQDNGVSRSVCNSKYNVTNDSMHCTAITVVFQSDTSRGLERCQQNS
jgi:hypothetical protein